MTTDEIVKLLKEITTFIEDNNYPGDVELRERVIKLIPLIEEFWG